MYWSRELMEELEKRTKIRLPCLDCLVIVVCDKRCYKYERLMDTGQNYSILADAQDKIFEEKELLDEITKVP